MTTTLRSSPRTVPGLALGHATQQDWRPSHDPLLPAEYWGNLPEEHKETLFGLHDEDFVAELDAHMRYHLKICKDCRGNVMKGEKLQLLACTALAKVPVQICSTKQHHQKVLNRWRMATSPTSWPGDVLKVGCSPLNTRCA